MRLEKGISGVQRTGDMKHISHKNKEMAEQVCGWDFSSQPCLRLR